MKLHTFLLTSLLALPLPPAFADTTQTDAGSAELRQQIEALTQRVEALERRLGQVSETQNAIVAETPLPASDPWQRLKIGMTSRKVEELLGNPLSKQKGSVEMWYYSEAKKGGPFVKLIFKQVHSWQAPEQ